MARCPNPSGGRHPKSCVHTAWQHHPSPAGGNPIMTASSTRRTAAKSRIAAVCAIAVAGTMLLAACGDQTKNGPRNSASAQAPLAGLLPKEIKDKGVIKVGSDIAYPPVEFKDKSGKTVGIDPDIGAALGKQLGVTFQF